jgi:hypothetical protein
MRHLLRRFLRQGAVVFFLCGCLAAQTKQPEREVVGSVIRSERDPAVRIQLPTSARYVGADRWILYDIADCELHAFVQADRQKKVKTLYWLQFEGYVPTRPELKHAYDSPEHATMGGMDFYVDTWVRPDGAESPGSDSEHIDALIRAKGYKMPEGMMSVRFVHLLDAQKRKELMVIYSEDVASTGFSAEELREGGRAYDRWPAIRKELVGRAEKALVIEP